MSESEPALHGPFAERLRRRYGKDVDPEISLQAGNDESFGGKAPTGGELDKSKAGPDTGPEQLA